MHLIATWIRADPAHQSEVYKKHGADKLVSFHLIQPCTMGDKPFLSVEERKMIVDYALGPYPPTDVGIARIPNFD